MGSDLPAAPASPDPESPHPGGEPSTDDPWGWRRPDQIQEPGTAPRAPLSEQRGFRPVLALALAVSLLTNVVVGVRLTDEQERARDLRARLERAEGSLERLRGDLRTTGPDDPLGRVVAAVEALRGLKFKTAVEPDLLSPADLRERLRETFLRDNDRADFDANERVLETLGVIPPELDLWKTILALQEEQVAGFYDSDDKTMVVGASDARDPSAFDRLLLAHELTHALTDQRFGLDRLDRLNDQDADDQASAFLALVEGDAQFLMGLYQSEVLTADEQRELVEDSQNIQTSSFDALPPALQNIFLFPYRKGLEFVEAIHRRGGYALVDKAYRDPPTSTEQILHPSKYLDQRDEPVTVKLPNVRRALGAGWRELERGGVGEYDLRVIADDPAGTPGLSEADARRAAEGWDGGRYVALESDDDDVVVATLTAWDSDEQAREAAQLFGRWLPLRYRNIGKVFDVGPQGRGWVSDTGAGIVSRNGDRMLLLLGPNQDAVERARAAFTGF